MADRKTQPREGKQHRRSLFRFDLVLLVFLLVGWSLIFITATLGLQRSDQQWLPVGLVANVAADYSPAPTEALKLARINPDVIEAIRQDQILRLSTPTPSPLAQTSTPLPTATSTATPFVGELAVSAGGPYNGQEGSLIRVTARDTGILGAVQGIISYAWDLDHDGQYDDATGISTSVIFYDEGEYPISVQASDWLGRVDTDTTVVSLSNAPPIVNIGQDTKTSEGEEVAFAATASDPGHDLLFYEWAFGDDSPLVKDTLNPRHTYVDDGSYTVRLRVRDNDGGITEEFLTVEVGNLPPLVDAGSDLVTTEGSKVALSGKATDPGTTDDLAYAWDFNYDGKTFTPDWDGQTASTVYPNGPANIVAALRVRDGDGAEAIDAVEITVNNVPPVITGVSDDSPVGEGSALALTVSATDVGKDDRLTYAFDWDGDGSFEAVRQPATVSNIWYNQNDYTVRIRVEDGDGGQAFTTTTVSVTNEPPVAVATVGSNILEGSPVAFDASDSQDPGRDDVLTYQWNFGDGSSATGQIISHVYADNKVYSTTLTVTDDSGAASAMAAPVTILNANPTANAGPDVTVNEGDTVNLSLNGTATDPGTADVPTLAFAWDCDDRNATFISGAADVTGPTPTCTYLGKDADNDAFNVTLRVRDDDYNSNPSGGNQVGEAFDTLKVTIQNVPPWDVCITAPVSHCSTTNRPEYRTTTGITLRFTGSGTDVSADPLTFRWDFDYDGSFDTNPALGQTVEHSWGTRGIYRVRLEVDDGDGGITPAEIRVNVGGVPTAIAGGPYSGNEGVPITFTSLSSDPDGDALQHTWNFGDGTSYVTNSMTTTHIYTDDGSTGIYTVTLNVDDGRGGVATAVATTTVRNVPPAITAAGSTPDPVSEGVAVTFNSSGSAGTYDALTYQWSFGDGQMAPGPGATHTYADNAVYSATLTLTDDDGTSASTAISVTVTNAAPLVEAGGPYSGLQGQQITLTGSATDVSPIDVLTYAWDLDNNGSFETPGQTVVNSWAMGGRYTVALRVTDDDGGFGTDTASVDINSIPIALAGGPYGGDEGTPIAFNGGGSSDPDPGDTLAYTWNFGDGSPAATGVTSTHTYADNRVYNITLRVEDDRGATAVTTTTATINNLPPTANAGLDRTVTEGQNVTFNGTATDPGAADTFTFQWDFSYDGIAFNVEGTGQEVAATFPDGPASATVALQVVDDDGGVSPIDTAVVTVDNTPPTANPGGPYATTVGIATTLTGNGSDVPADTLTYAWDFDYDGSNFDVDGTGQTAATTWTTPGNRTVALRVTDNDGAATISTTTVDVGSPPTADAGGPYTGNEGGSITLTGSGSDPDGDPLTFAWDLDNNGDFETSGPVVNNAWPDDGVFTVGLRVSDNRGGVATDTAQVTVTNVPPQNVDAGGPYATTAGVAVTISGSATDVPADPLTYSWGPDGGGQCTPSTGQSVDCTWLVTGTHTIMLEVNDGDGGVAQDTTTVQVNSVFPFVWGPLSYELWRRRRRSKRVNTLIKIFSGEGRKRRWQ